MIIKQIFTYNNYRNFNYLIACPKTREAIAVDPLAYNLCLKEAKKNELNIVAVINTHEHLDHTGGNEKIIAHTGAKLYAHNNAIKTIKGVDVGLRAGDKIKIGNSINIDILDTPGHTMAHICLLVRGSEDALFCGDTLFNAGVGNCHNGGNPLSLYNTFYNQLVKLDKKTKIFPGHDYLSNNLEFTLSLEPNNKHAFDLLQLSKKEGFSTNYVSSFETELKVNTFFRLKEASIVETLKSKSLLSKNDSPQEVFLALRELRNKW
ncbi:MAG: hydroxyacylglutathione hydrolase [Rickettsiales bacterium]|mgnify:CR=1 FL=1|nr:hydroxyacylglutathione hydrolase [Rickettsiales bacterium]OUV79118.1 MAG: hydroxyacylglutathione hydrolase [Rickettsiales bacterium TMED131]|tara:strand:- start:135 stop:923 length:789 start_codon:yes stop_codon:yes gene_type:complete